MDPNLQNILLGLFTNGLTAFAAQFIQKDSKLILGKELFDQVKLEETALHPIIHNSLQSLTESTFLMGLPNTEIVTLFLRSLEAEAIVKKIYAFKLSPTTENADNLHSIQKEFSASFYLYISSYAPYEKLQEEECYATAKKFFQLLVEGCEIALNSAIDQGKLSAHEAKSAFRHRLILEELNALQENISLLTSQEKPNVKKIHEFEDAYRRQVGNRHKFIIPPNFDKIRKVPIDKLYVAPNFSHGKVYKNKEGVRAQEILSYQEILSSNFRIVILGNPGGGKSTFANKLCYEIATNNSQQLLAGKSGITPILVVLRDYGAEKKKSNCSILEYIESKAKTNYQVPPPPFAFHYLLLNNRAIVIFDGLDELLETYYRQEISEDVESFCSLYPSVPVVVTSREIGYEQAPLDEDRFEVFYLTPFTDDQVKKYSRNWFDTVLKLPLGEREAKVQSFFEESKIVSDLRSNPLLLALLHNIYRNQNYIPKNRPEIYEKCANMLFESWDKSRGIDPKLPFEVHLRPVLMHLAFWIYSKEKLRGGVTEYRLVNEAAKYLSNNLLKEDAMEVARQFIKFCKGRAWVFTNIGSTQEGEELYQFTHQTFLEYFAASYLCRKHITPKSLLRILKPKISKREWDVVAQLAFQIHNRHVENGGNKLLDLLFIDACNETSLKIQSNFISFLVRSLKFIVASPAVIQRITEITIDFSMKIGEENAKILILDFLHTSFHDSSSIYTNSPAFLINDLSDALIENRDGIIKAVNEILPKHIESGKNEKAVVVLEIMGNFIYGDSYHAFPRGRISQRERISDAYWNKLKENIYKLFSEEVKELYSKNINACWLALRQNQISLFDLVKLHGIKSLFLPRRALLENTIYSPLINEIFNQRKPATREKHNQTIDKLKTFFTAENCPFLDESVFAAFYDFYEGSHIFSLFDDLQKNKPDYVRVVLFAIILEALHASPLDKKTDILMQATRVFASSNVFINFILAYFGKNDSLPKNLIDQLNFNKDQNELLLNWFQRKIKFIGTAK